jgi:tetratricopeptide (TPR) repeat protein
MKLKRCVSFSMVFLLCLGLCGATDFQKNVHAGMDALRKGYSRWNEEALRQARDVLLSAEKVSNGDLYAKYYVAYADYLLSIFYFTNDKEKAKNYLLESFAQLDKVVLTKSKTLKAEAYALYASGLGLQLSLGYDAAAEQVIGPKIEEYFAVALQEDRENPRVNLLRGIGLLHTPEIWGGGLDKAISFFIKSVNLFRQETIDQSLAPRWGHDEALLNLGIVYYKKGDLSQAEKCLHDSLKINPEFALAIKTLAEWKSKTPSLGGEKKN